MAETEPSRPMREQRFERRMTDAEALMWNVEKDPWLNPSGGAISIHDRMPDMDHLRAQLAYTVVTVPRLMEHVVGGVGRFSPPVWRPDPEFDLDYHIRVIALPSPGTMRQLLDVVTELYQDPYDRTRPLWMMYVIEGLEGGRAASMFKIHHAVADGTGAARLSELYIQPTREAPEPPQVDLDGALAEAVATDTAENGRATFMGNLVGTTSHFARRQAGIARRVAGEVATWGADPLRARDLVTGALRTVGQLRSQVTGGGGGGGGDGATGDDEAAALPGGSPLWRNRSRHRHLETVLFSLDDALAAAKGLGGSLNDWLMAGVVNGAVAYHDERGVPLRTLNTSFVVSTRADKAIGGNSFTPVRFSAPAGPMDPLDRFKALSAAMAEKRAQIAPGSGTFGGLAGLANLLPTSVVTSVARSQAAKMDFATSNMRSSKRRYYMSGSRVDEAYGFGPLAGTAFNLTSISYAGTFAITMFMDPVAIDEPASLREHVEDAYRELIDLGTSGGVSRPQPAARPGRPQRARGAGRASRGTAVGGRAAR
jgi:WS/DGAT/MGAT family acyltransferase